MKENNELQASDIVVDRELQIDDDNPSVINAYLETWFDVDEKFGTKTADDDDTWVNLYAKYNSATNDLCMEIIVDRADGSVSQDYVPTDEEKQMVVRMMEECSQQNYGCSLAEFCKDFFENEPTLGGIS